MCACVCVHAVCVRAVCGAREWCVCVRRVCPACAMYCVYKVLGHVLILIYEIHNKCV